ncbi:protein kinase domain-containing protein [Tautonia rosea]|uniref:protein kinase domain-containing protein n=1 Tax=Tautonia rosea TaxID=2728037 RepID=UPI0014762B6B|nr:protein kinase [Tautonia rosea]
MSREPEEDSLPLDDARRIDELCDRFEAEWSAGRSPRIEELSASAGGSFREALLRELIALEVHLRRGRGESPSEADYHRRFPDLAPQVIEAFASSPGEDTHRDVPGFPEMGDGAEPPWNEPPASSRYRILRLHARGGLGQVSLAIDRELDREVALKEIQLDRADDPMSRERFVREAVLTARLDHPGVVPVYSLGRYRSGRPFYAMRFIQGETLKEAISRFHETRPPGRRGRTRSDGSGSEARTPMSTRRTAYFAEEPSLSGDAPFPSENRKADEEGHTEEPRELAFRRLLRHFVAVCNAVAYAHSRRVIHRDLKPANILLGPFGETLIVDWGLAKPLDASLEEARGIDAAATSPSDVGTLPDSLIGTPGFMSPEQASGDRGRLGPASDVYSLGAILCTILTGRPPVDVSTARTAIDQTINGQISTPSAIDPATPKALDAIARRALASRPEDRYPTAAALADDVERWLADEPVLAHEEPILARGSRWMRRHRTLASTGTVAVLATLVGLALIVAVQNEANDRIRASLDAERNARRLADQQSALALDAIRSYYTGVGEEVILSHPEFDDLRRRLLESPRRLFATLSANLEATSFPTLEDRFRLARARLDLARLNDLAGSVGEALGAAVEARVQLERLEAEYPQLPALGDTLAESAELQARLLYRQGHSEEGAEPARLALDLRRRSLERDPADPDLRHRLARSHWAYAELLRSQGQTGGLKLLEDGLELAGPLVKEQPGVAAFRNTLADLHLSLGNLQGTRGQRPDAIMNLEIAVDQFRQLVGRWPDDTHSWNLARGLSDLALNRLRVAVPRLNPGRPLDASQSGEVERAVALWREAETILDRLVRTSPNRTDYQGRLSDLYGNLGVALGLLGRAEELEAMAPRTLAIAERLAGRYPDDLKYPFDLAVTLTNLAVGEARRNRPEAALTHFERSRAVIGPLVERHPDNPTFRLFAATNDLNRAGPLQELGRDSESLASLKEAERTLVPLSRSAPDDPRVRNTLSTIYESQTRHHLRLGQADQATTSIFERRDLWRGTDSNRLYEVAVDFARCASQVDSSADDAGHPLDGRARHIADEAIESLRLALDAGYTDLGQLRSDPRLAILRSDPSFLKLFDRAFPLNPFVSGSDIR